MKTIVMGFIKRAVVIPLVITAICFHALYFGLDRYNASHSAKAETPSYHTVSYDSFSDLSEGDYVGKISAGGIEKAVTYADSVSDSLFVTEKSGEPWNDGSVLVIGNSSSEQLGSLRHLSVGDKLEAEFLDGYTYTYVITEVMDWLTDKELKKLGGKNRLYLCRSYNDFSGSGTKLYAVYAADMI